MRLNVGSIAPNFTVQTLGGRSVDLAALRGRIIYLAGQAAHEGYPALSRAALLAPGIAVYDLCDLLPHQVV
jgi:hypothetical protein